MESFLKCGKLEKQVVKDSQTKQRHNIVPWVEKYRPRNVEDVVQQEEVIAAMKQILKGADLPNLLFYGPPGTGKTSTILAAAHQLFGSSYKDRIMELNASDERGINVVRDKIKHFSRQSAQGTVTSEGNSCPPFKLVILDEADAMTNAAQSALRRTMEKQTKSTRFCLICNYLSKIIAPITSRCSKFRFKPLRQSLLMDRLKYICQEENVSFENDKVLEIFIDCSEGDLRRAITMLQSGHRLKGKDHTITVSDAEEVCGVIPNKWATRLLEVIESSNYEALESYVEKFLNHGFPAQKLFDDFLNFVVDHDGLTDLQKAGIFSNIAECSFRLMNGGSEYMAVINLGIQSMQCIKSS